MANKAINASGIEYLVNKIKTLFVAKADAETVSTISIEDTPTSGSTNLVTSNGVYVALESKEDTSNKVTSLSSSSTNTQYPSAKAVYDNLAAKANDNAVVHLAGAESITGAKTFTQPIGVTSAATIQYNSTNECIDFIFF